MRRGIVKCEPATDAHLGSEPPSASVTFSRFDDPIPRIDRHQWILLISIGAILKAFVPMTWIHSFSWSIGISGVTRCRFLSASAFSWSAATSSHTAAYSCRFWKCKLNPTAGLYPRGTPDLVASLRAVASDTQLGQWSIPLSIMKHRQSHRVSDTSWSSTSGNNPTPSNTRAPISSGL